ncbi:MAG: hypothetical protein J6Y08_02215 [Clostridiales bacterium]|nr:hypothetical protein [Clostridiales bacterium]
MKHKKLLAAILAASMVLPLVGCKKAEETKAKKRKSTKKTTIEETETEDTEPSESETTEPTEDTKTSETSSAIDKETYEGAKIPLDPAAGFGTGEQDDLTAKLLEDDRVVAAEKRTAYADMLDHDKYVVFWSMPLDWEDPDAGEFLLRSELVLADIDGPNTFICDGYMLAGYFDFDFRNDFAETFDTNVIECEHRFFGYSVPEGLSNDSTDLWQYLTDENAAADFHYIIETYKTILSGKWAFTGGSKGGQLTHMQSHFYPDDADIYVSFVAPGGCAQDAPDFFDFIYTAIGNEAYGEAKAEEYRNLVLEFQVEAMKLKDKLADRYYQYGIQNGSEFNDFTTPEILYDMCVLEFATTFWQYFPDFDMLEDILAMDRSSDKFADKVFNYLVVTNEPDIWATTSVYFPYYVQAAKQNGEHEYDFSFLRAALAEQGLEDLLTVTEDMEEGLLYRMVFTDEQLETFTFDDSLYNDMVEWSHTTDCTVIMIYGARDVWYSMRLPDVTDNPNIHIYVGENASHMANLQMVTSTERAEIERLVKEALGI